MLNKCSLFCNVGLEKKNNLFISNETVIQKKLEYANWIEILFSYIIVTRLKALMQELVLLSLLTLIKQIKEFLASLLWGNCSDIFVAFYLTPPNRAGNKNDPYKSGLWMKPHHASNGNEQGHRHKSRALLGENVKTCENLWKLVKNCENLWKLVKTCENSWKLVKTFENLLKL